MQTKYLIIRGSDNKFLSRAYAESEYLMWTDDIDEARLFNLKPQAKEWIEINSTYYDYKFKIKGVWIKRTLISM